MTSCIGFLVWNPDVRANIAIYSYIELRYSHFHKCDYLGCYSYWCRCLCKWLLVTYI